jgi:hypothetical protein
LGLFYIVHGILSPSNPETGTAYWFSIAGMEGLREAKHVVRVTIIG